MNPITTEKLKINLRNAWRMWSNHVMVASGIAAAVFLGLPPEHQLTLMQRLPLPAWIVPIVVSVIGIGARLWPQKSISAATAAAKSEDAEQPPDPAA